METAFCESYGSDEIEGPTIMSKTENFGKPEAGEMRKLTLDVADLSSDQFLEITRICGLDVGKRQIGTSAQQRAVGDIESSLRRGVCRRLHHLGVAVMPGEIVVALPPLGCPDEDCSTIRFACLDGRYKDCFAQQAMNLWPAAEGIRRQGLRWPFSHNR